LTDEAPEDWGLSAGVVTVEVGSASAAEEDAAAEGMH